MSQDTEHLSQYELAARSQEVRKNLLLCTPALVVLLLAASGPLLVMLFYSFLEAGNYGGEAQSIPVEEKRNAHSLVAVDRR